MLDLVIEVTCRCCGLMHPLLVDSVDFVDWQNGKLAQDAFPYLTPDEREMLISGICGICWDEMFGEE